MPAAFRDCDVAVTSQSCYLVFFRVQTLCILGMAQCWNGMYSGIVRNHFVLVCSGTYLLVMHVMILRILFSIWYLVHLDLHSSDGCADLDVPSTKLKCRNPQDRDMHYKEVCTATDQYKWFRTIPQYVPLRHCANWVCTSLYLQFQNFHKYVPVCTWYVLVSTLKNRKMNAHNVEKSNQGSHAQHPAHYTTALRALSS